MTQSFFEEAKIWLTDIHFHPCRPALARKWSNCSSGVSGSRSRKVFSSWPFDRSESLSRSFKVLYSQYTQSGFTFQFDPLKYSVTVLFFVRRKKMKWTKISKNITEITQKNSLPFWCEWRISCWAFNSWIPYLSGKANAKENGVPSIGP